MKIKVNWGYYTDGDFEVLSRNEIEYNRNVANQEKGEFYDYAGMKTFEDDKDEICREKAAMFLKILLCSTSVKEIAAYKVIANLYNMFKSAIDFVEGSKGEQGLFEIGGIYKGTHIKVIVEK